MGITLRVNGAPEGIASRLTPGHLLDRFPVSPCPWRSPCGRLAMLDAQIGNPADLSNLWPPD